MDTAGSSCYEVKVKREKNDAGKREAELVTQMRIVECEDQVTKSVFSLEDFHTPSKKSRVSALEAGSSDGCYKSKHKGRMVRESSEGCSNPNDMTSNRSHRLTTPSCSRQAKNSSIQVKIEDREWHSEFCTPSKKSRNSEGGSSDGCHKTENKERIVGEYSEGCPNPNDVTPKRSERLRTPVKGPVPVENGEREWSCENKQQLISILEKEGFDGNYLKLALKLENRSNESIRYLIDDLDKKRKKLDYELNLDSKMEQLIDMEGASLTENIPQVLELQSLYGKFPNPDQVGGIDYAAFYAHVATLMRGEVPKGLDHRMKMKFSQLFNRFKEDTLAGPDVSLPEFKTEIRTSLEKKKHLKERRKEQWTQEELEAKEILVSGNVDKIKEFYLSHASLNPF